MGGTMKIYLGSDHNGFALKNHLVAYLQSNGYDAVDATHTRLDPQDDYPQAAGYVVSAMSADDNFHDSQEVRGILICGSGQGVCIAANRFKGIRASVCTDAYAVRAGRNDDDVNVLCLPSRTIDKTEVEKLVQMWLATPFAGADRYKRRIRELDQLG
jgi:ribose 5-phosphate isomerase B